MLTRCNPNPEGPSEVCDLAPGAGGRQAVGVAGRLHGWTALGFSLHLLTAGPWPGSQSPGVFIWEGARFYHEMRSQITGLYDKERPPPPPHRASTPLVCPPSAPTAQSPGGVSSYSVRVWKDPQTCNSTASAQLRPLDLDSLCSCLNFVKMRKKL